jgi:hypothetical protein
MLPGAPLVPDASVPPDVPDAPEVPLVLPGQKQEAASVPDAPEVVASDAPEVVAPGVPEAVASDAPLVELPVLAPSLVPLVGGESLVPEVPLDS